MVSLRALLRAYTSFDQQLVLATTRHMARVEQVKVGDHRPLRKHTEQIIWIP
eukprot:COSAG01_NODE_782_length_13631_cov_73.763450_8_plen_52_part_00